MAASLEDLAVADGDPIATEHIELAVAGREFDYGRGTSQIFETGGATTYVEGGQSSHGEWYVDGEGRFCSFWPPTYRACYGLNWIVEDGHVVGVRFTERDRGSQFAGRYKEKTGS